MFPWTISDPLTKFQSLPIPKPDLIARYKRLRGVSTDLNNRLISKLPREDLMEGGRRLGLVRGKTFCFNSEEDSCVLMDYCLYDVRRNGRNAIERYLVDTPPAEDSVEATILHSMQHAIYSIFEVEAIEPGLGIRVVDHYSNERHLIIDLGLAGSGQVGLILATRLLSFDGFSMTGGAAIALGVPPQGHRDEMIGILKAALKLRSGGDPAPSIKVYLDKGITKNTRFENPFEPSLEGPAVTSPIHTEKRIGRNDACSCGSGKKFKHCCLRRD